MEEFAIIMIPFLGTSLGAAMVFFLKKERNPWLEKLLLGFASGVMIAASVWSLLLPSIEMAKEQGKNAWLPAAAGFLLGIGFLLLLDKVIPQTPVETRRGLKASSQVSVGMRLFSLELQAQKGSEKQFRGDWEISRQSPKVFGTSQVLSGKKQHVSERNHGNQPKRKEQEAEESPTAASDRNFAESIREVAMLVLAVALHNLPEGMAVGVALAGAMMKNTGITMAGAMALSIGIAIQNLPEGAIISMPLRNVGASRRKAFWYGVLSGVVEPVGAAVTVLLAEQVVPLLPYLLAFAAGAMLYVVADELIPEAKSEGRRKIGTIGMAAGFVLMMVLDVAV